MELSTVMVLLVALLGGLVVLATLGRAKQGSEAMLGEYKRLLQDSRMRKARQTMESEIQMTSKVEE